MDTCALCSSLLTASRCSFVTAAEFDPDAVPDDRRGIRDSIVGRMTRHGGSAHVRSSSGTGTEVALSLNRRVRT